MFALRRARDRRGLVGESVLMTSGYTRVDGALWCDGVPLQVIADRVGTPAYVYSASVIRDRYTALARAFDGMPVRLHFAVKANSNLAVLNLLRELGAGVDIVSGGELQRALRAGFKGTDVVFSGVGKTADELAAALGAGIKTINVESPAELELLQQVAEQLRLMAPVALRVNPDVSVDTPHPYTRTGEHGMKFGIPDDQVLDVVKAAQGMPNISIVGVAAHLGSQISNPDPFSITAAQLVDLAEQITGMGVTTLRYLDIGGGIAVTYDDETPTDLHAFAESVRPFVQRSRLSLVLEPGRYLVAESGVLVTRVVYRKHSGGKEIVITDGAMNDLIRPALYEAYHTIEAVESCDREITADIVGPVCESGDFFGLDRRLGDVRSGDLIAIRTAGAYGFTMASNYNSRPRCAEVLVDGGRYAVVTQRETFEDLVRRETVTPTWNDL